LKQEVEATSSAADSVRGGPSNATIGVLAGILLFFGILLCYLVSTRFRL
jgi:hypothetical protein